MKPKNHPRPKTNPSRICKRSTSILFAGNPLPAWIYDLKSLRFLEVNDSALRQYGYTRDEFLSLTLNDIRQTDCTTGSDTLRGATEEIDDAWISTRKDGTKIYAQIHENDIRFRKRRARYVVIDDITERRYVQSELLRLAHYDALTGLPNRILMEQRMQQVLEGASKRGHRAGIICLDLDRFKEVNDWYGHEVGDECLRQVGIILTRRLRGMDVVARTGGGEFTILLGEVDSVASAGIVAKALSLAFASPVELDGYGVTLRPSLGVAVYPDHGTDGLELSRLAEAAMYRAKRAGGNRHETVAANLPIITAENAGVETHMRQMLLKGGFQLHYQLQYSMTGEVRGMEALLRLPHPKLGYVSPDRFIPIAEDNGLIHPLGKWVIEEACRQLKRWNSHQASPVRIAVNVSPLQLMRPDFVTDVKQAISLSGIDPAWLEMEITERVMLNFSEIAKRMEQLAALGTC
jgi:diguanylate cyclase (GGDEF)-like protein/PAS domain S-box-containing protein